MAEHESQIEYHEESENRAQAHTWVKENIAAITIALNKSLGDLIEIFRKNPDLADHFAPPCEGGDVFSSAICKWLMRNLPNTLLGNIKKVDCSAGREGREINHSIFMLGNIVIDPTSGQFILRLDEAIKNHPELFEERVLIATQEEIKNIFGLNYINLTNYKED